jgi:anthranilate/para-aminobenzoate synthase component II
MNSIPEELNVTATLEDDPSVVMAIEHKTRPIYGVQFHPESINTIDGKKLIKNFLEE